METQSIRKTYKYKLRPTPEQERMLEHTLQRCIEIKKVTKRRKSLRAPKEEA